MCLDPLVQYCVWDSVILLLPRAVILFLLLGKCSIYNIATHLLSEEVMERTWPPGNPVNGTHEGRVFTSCPVLSLESIFRLPFPHSSCLKDIASREWRVVQTDHLAHLLTGSWTLAIGGSSFPALCVERWFRPPFRRWWEPLFRTQPGWREQRTVETPWAGWLPASLNPLRKLLRIWGMSAEPLLYLQPLKRSLTGESPCFSSLLPPDLEWSASFFSLSLPAGYSACSEFHPGSSYEWMWNITSTHNAVFHFPNAYFGCLEIELLDQKARNILGFNRNRQKIFAKSLNQSILPPTVTISFRSFPCQYFMLSVSFFVFYLNRSYHIACIVLYHGGFNLNFLVIRCCWVIFNICIGDLNMWCCEMICFSLLHIFLLDCLLFFY